MNDSLRTNIFVRYEVETIACACVFLASRQLKVIMIETIIIMGHSSYNTFRCCYPRVPRGGDCLMYGLRT